MKIVRLVSAFLLALVFVQAINLELNGQELEPGTQYFDDVRGDEIVVTNAWDNVSNRVHELIQVVSPKTDISGKQDLLPYPTNAIPFSTISGVPSYQEKLPYPTNAIPYDVLKDVPTPSIISNENGFVSSDGFLSVKGEGYWLLPGMASLFKYSENEWHGEDEYGYSWVLRKLSENNWLLGWGTSNDDEYFFYDTYNAVGEGNELVFSNGTIEISLYYKNLVNTQKIATTNFVVETISNTKHEFITDGITTIHSDGRIERTSNFWNVHYHGSDYILNYISSSDVWMYGEEQDSFYIRLNYNNGQWLIFIKAGTNYSGFTSGEEDSTHLVFGDALSADRKLTNDTIASIHDVTNVVRNVSVTNNTLKLPMTDSATSERVYLKIENGEVNVYKVQ